MFAEQGIDAGDAGGDGTLARGERDAPGWWDFEYEESCPYAE